MSNEFDRTAPIVPSANRKSFCIATHEGETSHSYRKGRVIVRSDASPVMEWEYFLSVWLERATGDLLTQRCYLAVFSEMISVVL